jgi:hypothetical protein
VLLMQIEVDAQGVQLGQKADQVLQAAAEAVDTPGHHEVEPPRRRVLVQPVERRPLITTLAQRRAKGERVF